MAGAGALHVSRAAKDTYNRCGTWDSLAIPPSYGDPADPFGPRRKYSATTSRTNSAPGAGVSTARAERARHTAVSRSEPGHSLDA